MSVQKHRPVRCRPRGWPAADNRIRKVELKDLSDDYILKVQEVGYEMDDIGNKAGYSNVTWDESDYLATLASDPEVEVVFSRATLELRYKFVYLKSGEKEEAIVQGPGLEIHYMAGDEKRDLTSDYVGNAAEVLVNGSVLVASLENYLDKVTEISESGERVIKR